MSYHIHHAVGVIVRSVHAGEDSRYLYVLTREYGLVGMWAQGVRNMRSKMRHNLRDNSKVELAFVRGKRMWRIIDAREVVLYPGIHADYDKRRVCGKAAQIATVHAGEGVDAAYFDEYAAFLDIVEHTEEDRKILNRLLVVHAVRALSIVGEITDEGASYAHRAMYDIEALKNLSAHDVRKLIELIRNVSYVSTGD